MILVIVYNVIFFVFAELPMSQKDTIYTESVQEITPFEFNERVAKVFTDMIQRSVPGYHNCIAMLSVLAREYAQDGSQLYDLGCSLGAGMLALKSGLSVEDYHLVGIDNSADMIKRCENNLASEISSQHYTLLEEEIQNTDIDNASVVVLNFTLQFLPLKDRTELIQKIHAGLNPGGVLIISEKVRAEACQQALWQQLHEQFKRLNGYGEMEIAAKRTALENVLLPETEQTHMQRLMDAGFEHPVRWYQCFNFSSFLAIK